MNQESLLKTLYCQTSYNRTAPLRVVLETLFDGACIEEHLIDQALSCGNWPAASASHAAVLDKWRDMLTLILILKTKECLQEHLQKIVKWLHDLESISLWNHHQLFSAYHALAAFLLNQPSVEPQLTQQPNGACPLEADGYSLWAEVPHPLFHAELGTLWCLYGDLTGSLKYVEAAVKLAKWQQNTLDHQYTSFVGLLSREGEVSERQLLVNNFLLFNAVARIANCLDMAFFAKKQLERLSEVANTQSLDIPSYSIVLESYFDKKPLPAFAGTYDLPAVFSDEAWALTGFRSLEKSVIATIYGGNSGMGCYHYKDVKVVNFGPQHSPLGDCRSFGVEGSKRVLGTSVKILLFDAGEFTLEGTTRLSPNLSAKDPASAIGGSWMESKQMLKDGALSIEVEFNELLEQGDLFFSFFVKCRNCVIDGGKMIRPRSLNRYNAKAASLRLQGDESDLILDADQRHEEMHVIPLAGGDNFWGADFLVAYLLKDKGRLHSWKLRPWELGNTHY